MRNVFCMILLFGLVFSCKERAKTEIKTETVAFTKEGELHIFRPGNDSLLVTLDIEFAETEYETQTGLMYRQSMEDNQGMLFIFPDVAMHSFYMKNTEFPLDIVFIDENQKIVTIQKDAQPLDEKSISSVVPVKYVLEINAGLSEKWQLQVGDSIAYVKN
ncbi:MAG: hypothetical protein CMH48_09695 [Muricauda sp.]|nr:hypothetical protein [Allomuricauda sp.]